MKLLLSFICVLLTAFSLLLPKAYAAENPLAVANNKVGIHILFPEELERAAKLVNSNGGDWGYVVIPIQSGDKDLVKWQQFMNDAKKFHVIPLIRLATEGDYFNTKVWRKPTPADVLDFANFLNSLSWPTKNRYIVVYNEVNRGDEWGGSPDPDEYAKLLSYAVSAFKTRSTDFFIISAGMDNAAATTAISMDEYSYLYSMNTAVPGIFDEIDGMGSHSYPNPGFSQLPTLVSRESITSFQFEKQLISTLSSKNLPVFITETGWQQDVVGQSLAAQYMSTAFQTVWTNSNIVTVAPFLLQAGGGPFTGFSLYSENGSTNAVYTAIQNLPKVKGAPVVVPEAVLAANVILGSSNVPAESFTRPEENTFSTQFETGFKQVFKWLLRM